LINGKEKHCVVAGRHLIIGTGETRLRLLGDEEKNKL